jgi:hypothetical protein
MHAKQYLELETLKMLRLLHVLWRELRKLLLGDVVGDVESFVKRVKSLCPDAKVYLFESYAKGMRLRASLCIYTARA